MNFLLESQRDSNEWNGHEVPAVRIAGKSRAWINSQVLGVLISIVLESKRV